MAEEPNLGEAIGRSTGLRTGFAQNDFLHGLQLGENQAFRQAQYEAARAEKERKLQDSMSRFITKGKTYSNLEVQKEYELVHRKLMGDAYRAHVAGLDTTQHWDDLNNQAAEYGSIDKSITNIKKDPVLAGKYAKTTGPVAERVHKLAQDQTNYLMPERLVVDEQGIGNTVKLPVVPTRQLNKGYDAIISDLNGQHKKLVGTVGTKQEYVLDVNSPGYKASLTKAVDNLMADPAYVGSVKEGYESEYKKGIDELRAKYPDVNEDDALDVVRAITERNLGNKVVEESKLYSIPQPKADNSFKITAGGGASVNGFTFTPVDVPVISDFHGKDKDLALVRSYRPETQTTGALPKEITVEQGQYRGRKVSPSIVTLGEDGKYYAQGTVQNVVPIPGEYNKFHTVDKVVVVPVTKSQLQAAFSGKSPFDPDKLFGISAGKPANSTAAKPKFKNVPEKVFN